MCVCRAVTSNCFVGCDVMCLLFRVCVLCCVSCGVGCFDCVLCVVFRVRVCVLFVYYWIRIRVYKMQILLPKGIKRRSMFGLNFDGWSSTTGCG